MTQGYDGPLPPYYVQSSNPQTPNLGLTLIGVDPIVAYNFVLIDTAVGAGGGVTSLNTLTGAITLAAGSNITLTPVGNTITIASSGGAPGSPTSSVQFNNSGAFGGDSKLTWDNTNKVLGIGTSTPVTTAQLT